MNKSIRIRAQKKIRRRLRPELWKTNKIGFINKYRELYNLYGPNVDIVIKQSSFDGIRDELEKLLILL